jgi:8-hydroxy-5-deazaflavin:NADPH oxidoreductase
MDIAIIGSGKIGSTAARLFTAAGHDVAIANSRGPESLHDLEGELGARARAATVQDAARFGELVLVAIPFGAIDQLPADAFASRIVLDANNYYPERDGHVAALDDDTDTSSEALARQLPGARVVKAFNTMNYRILAEAGDPAKPPGERLALYLAGDDPEAKKKVAALVDELGFAPVDVGDLAAGRALQPGSRVYGADLTAAQARAALAT